jgi:menaquinol-cytochrome c reductase iron-sulfur subunit
MSAPVPERRRVVQLLASLLGLGAAGLVTVPVLGTVLTPLLRKKEGDGGLIEAGKVDDLVEGLPKRVELIATVRDGWTTSTGVVGAVWLLKKKDGSVSALSSVCPHSGCSIKLENKDTYSCPCHDSLFTFDGAPTKGPSPRSMDPLTFEVHEGKVRVKWARFKIGVKDRIEL